MWKIFRPTEWISEHLSVFPGIEVGERILHPNVSFDLDVTVFRPFGT